MSSVVKAMAEAGMVVSCSQARRAVMMGAVKVNGKSIDDILAEVKAGDTIQLGKREAIRIGEEPDSKSGAGKTVASSNLAASAQGIDETAKEVVKGKRLVVVEKLRQMNKNTKLKRRLSKNMRRSLGTWNYRYWLMRVEAACEIGRSSFRSVAPQYISQRCHACGHTERGNRNGEIFKCRSCGHADNADVNAAKNILLRFTTGPYGASFQQKILS